MVDVPVSPVTQLPHQRLPRSARNPARLVQLVWIDGAYDMVRFQKVAKYGRDSGVEFGPVDVVRLAESFGAKGMMIRQPEEFATTLKRAIEIAGPVVVGIPVDYRDNHRLMEIVHQQPAARAPVRPV